MHTWIHIYVPMRSYADAQICAHTTSPPFVRTCSHVHRSCGACNLHFAQNWPNKFSTFEVFRLRVMPQPRTAHTPSKLRYISLLSSFMLVTQTAHATTLQDRIVERVESHQRGRQQRTTWGAGHIVWSHKQRASSPTSKHWRDCALAFLHACGPINPSERFAARPTVHAHIRWSFSPIRMLVRSPKSSKSSISLKKSKKRFKV